MEVKVINADIECNNVSNYCPKKSKKRVCAYCRVSTDMEDQKSSYNSQITHYTNYIKKNPDWEFAGIYADEGITGTQIKNRDKFIQMINDCKKGLIDIVIAKSISRFARNTVDTLNTVRLLRELDIDIFFEKENIHTLKLDSEMFLTLYSAFAQAESESISLNVKMGYRAKMKRGEPCGSIACYGYIWNKEKKELKVDKEKAKVIRKIFNYYLDGLGSTRIAQKLMSENIPAPNGGKNWHPCSIKTIIRNVKYVGDICGQRFFVDNPITHKLVKNRGQKAMYYVHNQHEAIIPRDIFDKAQEIYNKRSNKIKEGKIYCEKYSRRYTFSSKIFCGNCGRTYVRRCAPYKNKDGVIHTNVYWACSSKASNTKVNKSKCDSSITIRDDELKSLFVALFNKFLQESNNNNLLKKITDIINKDETNVKLNKINKEIEDQKSKILKLIDLNINENINKEVFEMKNSQYNNELLNLEQEKVEIEKDYEKVKKEKKRLKKIEEVLKDTKTIHQFDDNLFNQLIKKIEIGEKLPTNEFVPNVVKFYLNIDTLNQNEEEKFLSLEIDERVPKTSTMRR